MSEVNTDLEHLIDHIADKNTDEEKIIERCVESACTELNNKQIDELVREGLAARFREHLSKNSRRRR